jgi:hypothetical protein
MPKRPLLESTIDRAAFRRVAMTAIFTVLAVLTASGCSTLKTRPPVGVQLSGTWQLNESLSNGLSALSESGLSTSGGEGRGMRRSGGRGGGAGGGGGGRKQRGGMGGGSGSSDSGAGDSGRRERAAGTRRPKLLLIDQSATEIKLVADGASEDLVYGAKTATPLDNGKAETSSGWDAESFVVTQKIEKGPTITRTYEKANDGDRMIVETDMSGGHGPKRKVVSVYEHVVKSPAS